MPVSAAPAAFTVALAVENWGGGDWILFTVFGEITTFFHIKKCIPQSKWQTKPGRIRDIVKETY